MKKVLRTASICILTFFMLTIKLSVTAMAPEETIISEDYIPSEEITVVYNTHYTTSLAKRPSYKLCGYKPKEIEMVEFTRHIEEYNSTAEEEVIIEENEVNKYAEQEEEYPAATFVWHYLTEDQGYNPYVAAGIMGNIMAEIGGQTLSWDYTDRHGSYYGMCQWNIGYYPGVVDEDLEGQCDFLMSTIENEFADFGFISGYSYEEFLAIEDEQAAALAFAKTYERCGSGSYGVRKTNATKALEYYVIE